MYATQGRYNVRVSKLKHYYGLNHLHYLITRTYRRTRRNTPSPPALGAPSLARGERAGESCWAADEKATHMSS
jgi:hypothetical protein